VQQGDRQGVEEVDVVDAQDAWRPGAVADDGRGRLLQECQGVRPGVDGREQVGEGAERHPGSRPRPRGPASGTPLALGQGQRLPGESGAADTRRTHDHQVARGIGAQRADDDLAGGIPTEQRRALPRHQSVGAGVDD
jgi:hypothetical protein